MLRLAVLCVCSFVLVAAFAGPPLDTTISGVVRMPDGKPAVGVVVEAVADMNGLPLALGMWKAKSDAKGEFRIRRVHEGAWIVRAELASRDASTPSVVRLPWYAEAKGVASGASGLELRLAEGSQVAGRVVDDRGEPLKAFTIELKHVVDVVDGKPAAWTSEPIEITTSDGGFEIHGVRAGTCLVALAAAGHAAPNEVSLQLPATVPPLTIAVPRAAQVRGVVVDAAGAPVAGARVTVLAPGVHVPSRATLDMVDELVTEVDEDAPSPFTDASGRFVLEGVRPGAGVLRADADGHARSVPRTLEIAPGSTVSDLRIALRKGATLRGVVRDPSGAPLEGVDVGVIFDDDSTWQVTCADGSFRFEHVMPGQIVVAAREDLQPGAKARLVPEVIERVMTVLEGEEHELPLGGPPSATTTRVRGVVRGALSVANAKVRFVPSREGAEHVETRTRADGAFELELAEKGEYWVVLHLPSDSLAERSVWIGDEREQVVDLALPGTLLRGRVVDASGAPVRARLRLRRTDVESSTGGWSTVASDDASKDGSFVFEGLERGPWRMTVTPKDRKSALARRHQVVDLSRAERTEDFVVTLAPGGVIEGLVRGPDGKPLAGARVAARGEDGFDDEHEVQADERASSDQAGRFRIAGLAPGTWRVRAVAEALASGESEPLVVASNGTTAAEIALAPAGLVDVRLEDEAGQPLRHGPGEWSLVCDAHGRAWHDLEKEEFGTTTRRLGPLPPGRWTLRRGDGTRFAAVEVDVRAGEIATATHRRSPSPK